MILRSIFFIISSKHPNWMKIGCLFLTSPASPNYSLSIFWKASTLCKLDIINKSIAFIKYVLMSNNVHRLFVNCAWHIPSYLPRLLGWLRVCLFLYFKNIFKKYFFILINIFILFWYIDIKNDFLKIKKILYWCIFFKKKYFKDNY